MTAHETDHPLDPRLARAFETMQQLDAEHPDWPGYQQRLIQSLPTSRPSLADRISGRLQDWLKQPASRVGLATSALLAMVVGLLLLTSQPGISYASVAAQLRQMNTMILTSIVAVSPQIHTETIIHYQRPDRIRSQTVTWMNDEPLSTTLTLTDLSRQQSVVLMTDSKMAMRITLPEQVALRAEQDPLFWLEDLKQWPADAAIDLGTRDIDGHQAQGYQVRTEWLDIVIWADQQTAVPVRFEITGLPDRGLPEDFLILGDAQIDVAIDPALFELQIPSDYRIMPVDARQ